MGDDLAKLVTAIGTGRRTRRIVTQNLALSLLILAVLVPAALFGIIGLAIAVLAHELSELVVILTGTRMARRWATRVTAPQVHPHVRHKARLRAKYQTVPTGQDRQG